MARNLNPFIGKPKAVGETVLVTDMYFGEQKTSSGIILTNDDGKTRGIYPRWARVYNKGPKNEDEFVAGQWILIKHGRWTRSFTFDDGESEVELRMIDPEAILAYSIEKPESVQLGAEYSDGSSATVDPSLFAN